MKKLYILSVMMFAFGSAAFSQKANTQIIRKQHSNVAGKLNPINYNPKQTATPTDTLVPTAFQDGAGSAVTWSVTGGLGYIFGTNDYGDKAKAQQFILSEGTLVEGAIIYFSTKSDISGTNGKVAINVYRMDGQGYTTTDTVGGAAAPGSIAGSVDLYLSDVVVDDDSIFPTFINFPNPVYVGGDFALGFDMAGITSDQDSIAAIASDNGEAGQTELSWEKWSDGDWHTIMASWGNGDFDTDMLLYVVVDNSSAGVEGNNFFDGIKMSQNQPNPAGSETTIQYEIQNNATVSLEIFDVMGRKVVSMNEGEKNKGKHSINITTEKLASGTYYYSLKANDKRLTKKMVITK